MSVEIRVEDCLTVLGTLPPESVNCCVTSPPYWGLRDYGVPGQLGLEATPEEYVARMVAVFREVRRVLRDDGTLWLNVGDSYAANRSYQVPDSKHVDVGNSKGSTVPPGLKPKDLVGIPWMLAFALRADGWWLRSDIIWAKPNPMPESVTDRPTKAHEYVFLMTKAERYWYDAAAIREPCAPSSMQRCDSVGSPERPVHWQNKWKDPEFTNESTDDLVLKCPLCGMEFLHQTAVEVFQRGEDEVLGTHVVVSQHEAVVIDRKMVNNPSSRRQGLRIRFECESCHMADPTDHDLNAIFLCIVQHKGWTQVFWEREHPVAR